MNILSTQLYDTIAHIMEVVKMNARQIQKIGCLITLCGVGIVFGLPVIVFLIAAVLSLF